MWTVPSIGSALHEAASATGRLAQLALVRYPLAERPPLFFHYFKRYRGVTVKFSVRVLPS